jgi:hypothetical protein
MLPLDLQSSGSKAARGGFAIRPCLQKFSKNKKLNCAIMPTNMKPELLFALNNNNNTNDDRSAAVRRSTSG